MRLVYGSDQVRIGVAKLKFPYKQAKEKQVRQFQFSSVRQTVGRFIRRLDPPKFMIVTERNLIEKLSKQVIDDHTNA